MYLLLTTEKATLKYLTFCENQRRSMTLNNRVAVMSSTSPRVATRVMICTNGISS